MPQVTLKLFAMLQKHLPAGTKGRQAEIDVPEGATVGDLLSGLGISDNSVHLIMVNGEQGGWTTPVGEGDAVTVFPPVAGG